MYKPSVQATFVSSTRYGPIELPSKQQPLITATSGSTLGLSTSGGSGAVKAAKTAMAPVAAVGMAGTEMAGFSGATDQLTMSSDAAVAADLGMRYVPSWASYGGGAGLYMGSNKVPRSVCD